MLVAIGALVCPRHKVTERVTVDCQICDVGLAVCWPFSS